MTNDPFTEDSWEPTHENILGPGDVVKFKKPYSPMDVDEQFYFGIVVDIVSRYSEGLQEIDSGNMRADMPDLLENAPIPKVGAPRNISVIPYTHGEGTKEELRTYDIGRMYATHRVPTDDEQYEEEGGMTVVPDQVDMHIAELILVMKAGDTYTQVPRNLDVLAYIG